MDIAVIRFSSLGDVVLSTAILQKLSEENRDCAIDFITDSAFTGLFSSDSRIRSLIPYDIPKETVRYMRDFLMRLRERRYDLVIDAQCNPRSLVVSSLARAGERRRVQKYGCQRRLMVKRHRVWEIPHAVKRYLAAVDGVGTGSYRPSLCVDGGDEEKVRREIEQRSGDRGVVGIAPGAGKRTKIWDVEKMQRLVLSLTATHGLFPIFLGGREGVQLIDAICKVLKGGYLNLAGKTGFRELALYVKACDILLCTDSGPMHVAVAVDTPVIALFGPTVPEFGFSPYDERSITISVDIPCRPCSLHGTDACPRGHHRCMREIEVGVVEEAILKLLAKK
jgi:heptosyltransferase-2